MRLAFHPGVAADISEIMDYYAAAGGARLAEEFYEEFRRSAARAAISPERHAIRARDLRRANLERFPYHFLFRVVGDEVRVLVVRHNRRHPRVGASRG